MAFWSGAAQVAFKQLTEALGRLDAAGEIELLAVDVDGSETLYELPEFQGRVGGYGETAWVRNGKIVSVSIHPTGADIEANTLALLAMG
jgi:hypothetical protein